MPTRRTIHLPDDLVRQVDEYLKLYPYKSFSALVQDALRERVAPRDPREILRLAGLVDVDPVDCAPDERFGDRPEDSVVLRVLR